MESIIADSGVVVAPINKTDQRHDEVRPIYLEYAQILLPQFVLVEVAYLVGRDAGIPMVVRFLQGITNSRFQIIAATDQDLRRTAELLDIYSDSRLDFVDASILVIAERLEIQTILTIDQRDFRMVRPKHRNSFDVKP